MNAAQRRPRVVRTVLATWGAGALLFWGGLFSTVDAQSGSTGAAPTQGQPASGAVAKVLPPPTPAELAEGQALLDRAVKATLLGNPADLKSFAWSDSGLIHVGPEVFPVNTNTVLVPSRCYWSEQLLPMGIVTVAYCDTSGWVRTARGVRSLNEAEWKQQRRDREMDLVRVLLDASKLKARILPDTVLSAGPAAGVAVASERVTDWRIWMDKKTGRIVRSDWLDPPPTGQGIARHAWEYHDYQPVSTLLRWPSIRAKTIDGTLLLDLFFKRAQSNAAAPDSLFKRP